jgi:hypothetical protein
MGATYSFKQREFLQLHCFFFGVAAFPSGPKDCCRHMPVRGDPRTLLLF